MNTDNVLKSNILFLDSNFRPIDVRQINRPEIWHHTQRTDHNKIMKISMEAFNNGKLVDDDGCKVVPKYWVAIDGSIANFKNTRIEFSSYSKDEVSKYIRDHFRFTSYQDCDEKIYKLLQIFDLVGVTPKDIKAHELATGNPASTDFVEPPYVVIPLLGWTRDWDIGNLMESFQNVINECSDAIKTVRDQINEAKKNIRFIETHKTEVFRASICYAYELNQLMVKPALKMQADKIHTLKKRMQTLERQRSWIQDFVSKYIYSQVWIMK